MLKKSSVFYAPAFTGQSIEEMLAENRLFNDFKIIKHFSVHMCLQNYKLNNTINYWLLQSIAWGPEIVMKSFDLI